MFTIDYATDQDVRFWLSQDRHIKQSELILKIRDRRCYIIKDNDTPVGILRYGLFWDECPFLNLIYFVEAYRNKGYGTKAMRHWENEMREAGYKIILTSTMVDEGAQHFYRKLGYKDCGCLILDNSPLIEAMEMFMMKRL